MSKLCTEACPVAYPHLGHDWRGPKSWARCPGIRIDAATRAQPVNTRRHVLAELRWIKDQLAGKIGRWNVTGIEYDGNRHVPRRVGAFPENDADAWAALARTCREAAAELGTLATYALIHAEAVEAYEKRRVRAALAAVRALRDGDRHVG